MATGTREDPWMLTTPPGTSEYFMFADGRVGMYLPPLLEALGLAEVTHDARNNRMRAL